MVFFKTRFYTVHCALQAWYRVAIIAIVLMLSLLLPKQSHASFIETTMGTAVVNDATASYFNPAALLLLKNAQFIPLLTAAQYRTTFNGKVTTVASRFSQSGSSGSTSNYYSPSFYSGVPLNDKVVLGLAVVSNFANRNVEENSILRYVQSSNTIQDYDIVPALGVKLNNYFSLGAGINFSYTRFDLLPIINFPGTNNPDAEASNQSKGSGVGGNAGFLFRPRNGTLVGFDYRTQTVYHENGTSRLDGAMPITSSNYQFLLKTPARSILSLSQSLTAESGLIMTVQRINWSTIRNIQVKGIATVIGSKPVVTNGTIPQYLRNTWILTLGGNYRFKPAWIFRIAGTYSQSPRNSSYQITNGDSYILGASMGYDVNKTLTVDASYAHAFIQDENSNIRGARYLIVGKNSACRDAVSLKLTVNV